MPFEEIETLTKENMPPEASVSYMRPSGKNGPKKDAKPRLLITLPTTICGRAKSERFKLLLGDGNDLGKVRIKGVPKGAVGGVKPTELAHAFRFSFGFVPRLGEDAFNTQKQPLKIIGDDEFEITVPKSWFEAQ